MSPAWPVWRLAAVLETEVPQRHFFVTIYYTRQLITSQLWFQLSDVTNKPTTTAQLAGRQMKGPLSTLVLVCHLFRGLSFASRVP